MDANQELITTVFVGDSIIQDIKPLNNCQFICMPGLDLQRLNSIITGDGLKELHDKFLIIVAVGTNDVNVSDQEFKNRFVTVMNSINMKYAPDHMGYVIPIPRPRSTSTTKDIELRRADFVKAHASRWNLTIFKIYKAFVTGKMGIASEAYRDGLHLTGRGSIKYWCSLKDQLDAVYRKYHLPTFQPYAPKLRYIPKDKATGLYILTNHTCM